LFKIAKVLFGKLGGTASSEKIWAGQFRDIEKLVRKKDFGNLESRLEKAVSWIESRPPGEILPEWLNQAGLIFQAYTGNFDRAEECFNKAKVHSDKQANIREKALAMTNLGVLYLDQNRSAEAVEIFTALKPLIADHFGLESRETATVCQNLAAAYRLDGNEESAKQERITATGILRKIS